MDLVNLKKHTECPHCGSNRIILERIDNQHSNGSWNEYRKFDCGCVLHFSPNFMKVIENDECSKSPEALKRDKKRRQAHIRIRAFINELDLDEAYKKRLQSDVYNCSYCNFDQEFC